MMMLPLASCVRLHAFPTCSSSSSLSAPSRFAFFAGDISVVNRRRRPHSPAILCQQQHPTTGENSRWSPSLSAELYGMDKWGAPYFTVNSSGNISICPHGETTSSHHHIDLLEIVKKASDPISSGGLGLQLPLIVRFPDVLKHRLESLHVAFSRAIQSHHYKSHYQGVYPVKCNQDRLVVEDIVRFGSNFRFGLEAGSKPELLLAMTYLCKAHPEAFLICNGFKDREYISLALLARNQLALNTVIVLDQEEEVDSVIELSNKVCVRPVIGLRAKLRTNHSGHFGTTSGEKAKFGLTTAQILRVVAKLERAGMLECLQLLHFHMGSMIPSTSMLGDGVREASQIYCELVRLGANMKVIDIGGGLGVDYDGSKSTDSDVSIGYGLEEYATSVVQEMKNVCDRRGVKHPVICSESGRAIVSHQSILVFEAISTSTVHEATSPNKNTQIQLKQLRMKQFKQGTLSIEQLAAMEEENNNNIVSTSSAVRSYHVNLSVFNSIADFLVIGQLFPILPIHRLDEQPTVKGILSDLTGDSDGKIDKFIGHVSTLPLHELQKNDVVNGKYYLGMFLGGAYQETIGGVHNLLGGPSLVCVTSSEGSRGGGYVFTCAVQGQSCSEVLRVMRHMPEVMYQTLKKRVESVVKNEINDANSAVASSLSLLASSFNNMPYLVASSPSTTTTSYYTINQQDDDDQQFCYCDNSNGDVCNNNAAVTL